MSDNSTAVLVSFHVTRPTYTALTKAAFQHGYQSPSGYARALAEQAVGVNDFSPLSVTDRPLMTDRESIILNSLLEKPKTISEIATENGKWYTSLKPIAKQLLAKGWITEVESKFSGGRPSMLYSLGEAGRLRLEQEGDRLKKNKEKAEQYALNQRIASARAHPDKPEPERLVVLDQTTPQGKFRQAIVDALYKLGNLTTEQIKEKFGQFAVEVDAAVADGFTTYADEQLNLELDGWVRK